MEIKQFEFNREVYKNRFKTQEELDKMQEQMDFVKSFANRIRCVTPDYIKFVTEYYRCINNVRRVKIETLKKLHNDITRIYSTKLKFKHGVIEDREKADEALAELSRAFNEIYNFYCAIDAKTSKIIEDAQTVKKENTLRSELGKRAEEAYEDLTNDISSAAAIDDAIVEPAIEKGTVVWKELQHKYDYNAVDEKGEE